jgi:hypothetical protein
MNGTPSPSSITVSPGCGSSFSSAAGILLSSVSGVLFAPFLKSLGDYLHISMCRIDGLPSLTRAPDARKRLTFQSADRPPVRPTGCVSSARSPPRSPTRTARNITAARGNRGTHPCEQPGQRCTLLGMSQTHKRKEACERGRPRRADPSTREPAVEARRHRPAGRLGPQAMAGAHASQPIPQALTGDGRASDQVLE